MGCGSSSLTDGRKSRITPEISNSNAPLNDSQPDNRIATPGPASESSSADTAATNAVRSPDSGQLNLPQSVVQHGTTDSGLCAKADLPELVPVLRVQQCTVQSTSDLAADPTNGERQPAQAPAALPRALSAADVAAIASTPLIDDLQPGSVTGSAPSPMREVSGPAHAAESLPRVNKYTMLEVIGKGAYGKVRRCIDESACELRAVKILPKSFLKRKRVGRFGTAFDNVQKEIAVWKKLDHKHVVKLFEVIDDESADKLYLVGEFISGGAAMPDCTGCAPLPVGIARVLAAQLVEALSYLHFQGIAHRDIKPGNLLVEIVTPEQTSEQARREAAESARKAALAKAALGRVDSADEEVVESMPVTVKDGTSLSPTDSKFSGVDPSRIVLKVTDFGVSQVFTADGDDSSRTTAGTAPFLAPEMLTGDNFSGKAADTYAVGVTLYMFLYGRPPFLADSVSDLYELIKTAPIPWPDETAVGTAVDREAVDEARDLICRLMDRNPSTRMTLDEAQSHPFLRGHAKQAQHAEIITVTPAEVRSAVSSVVRFRAMVQAAMVGKRKLLAVRRKLAGAAGRAARPLDSLSGIDPGLASSSTTQTTVITESSIAYSTAAAADLSNLGIVQEDALVVGQPRYEIVTEAAI